MINILLASLNFLLPAAAFNLSQVYGSFPGISVGVPVIMSRTFCSYVWPLPPLFPPPPPLSSSSSLQYIYKKKRSFAWGPLCLRGVGRFPPPANLEADVYSPRPLRGRVRYCRRDNPSFGHLYLEILSPSLSFLGSPS